MVWFGTLLALALTVAGYATWRALRARQMSIGNSVGLVALALWLTGVTVAWLAGVGGAPNPAPRSDSLALTTAPASAVAPTSTGVQAAPIESLVTGLEARLAAQPNDAQGWTLLAQSYAYTADEAGAERAVRRAVELGVDEAMLRERVARAKRSAHPTDIVDEALKTGLYR